MPNSLLSQRSVDVRAFLATALPDARLIDAQVDSGYQPLLLMHTRHTVVAFAFSNGNLPTSYEALYGSFRNYYAAQEGRWDTLDLAFVFCVQPGLAHLDDFCSNVETDVYFCRKFVIPLSIPLDASLARLPFLPLSPLHGQSHRPPSAQTFLQQCGVPAMLAKFLVVQHERSPEGIVEDCTAGKFGEIPRPSVTASAASVVQPERLTEQVRLETMEIMNFRAYRKPQTFALGADVTILYGPNGFGKTSFFDAIDFAVTGGIGRIELHRPSDFAKAARHLDAGSEESTVSLTFRSNGAVRTITRSVGDRKQALLDGLRTDRKAILSELTRSEIPATDRVENFVNLFRASHLFSQEHQELTKGFQDDCALPSDIVSRLLAFEDYANALKKAVKVRDVVQSAIANAGDKIEVLAKQIASDNNELDRLGQTAKAHANVGALETEIRDIRSKLEAAGITVTAAIPDATMIRGWRAALESRYSMSRATSERFAVLAKELAGLPRMVTQLSELQQQLKGKEEALMAAEEKRIAAEQGLLNAERRLAEMTAKRVEAQARSDMFEWVRDAQPRYVRLIAQQNELGTELQRANDALAQLRAAEDKALGELRLREVDSVQLSEMLQIRRAELAAAQALHQAIPTWQAYRTRLASVQKSEEEQRQALESARAEERELAPQLAAVAAEEARLAREIAVADSTQSELLALVSQLQSHVRTGTCPLCGEDHGSRDRLLQRIQEHVAADAVSGARKDLTRVRHQSKQLAEKIATNKEKQQAAADQIAALGSERVRLEAEIAHFVIAASKSGIVVEAIGPTPSEQVEHLATRLQEEVANINKQVQAAVGAVEAARAEVANAKNVVAAKNIEAHARKVALVRAQEEANHVRADPRLTQVTLDVDSGQLAELEKVNLTNLEEFKAEASGAEAEANRKRSEIGVLRQEVTSLKSDLAALRTLIGNFQKAVAQINVRLDESKLPLDSTEKSLLALIADQSRLQAQLLSLRDSTSSLELAMDAATTAAALTTLRQAVREREKEIAQATTKRDKHRPWLTYFDEILRLVASRQDEAIANFTRQYGPRTSVIQRRLRSVYGFDEIEIQSRKSAINVRVKRHGEELRPTDYFSQSQQQTLLLGLFLTACSSQTWSALSPVFLDDPVTHFDDLNMYAFLDLVDGLLETEVGRRQFIISTCDEKLLQLARQKFRHLNDRAKYYVFTAIGADGPTVNDVC